MWLLLELMKFRSFHYGEGHLKAKYSIVKFSVIFIFGIKIIGSYLKNDFKNKNFIFNFVSCETLKSVECTYIKCTYLLLREKVKKHFYLFCK